MIDYNKPDEDPIVAEVRRAREEIAARYNYDLQAIAEGIMKCQARDVPADAAPSTYVASKPLPKKVG